MAQFNTQYYLGQARQDSFLGGVMQRQISNSDRGLPGNFAGRMGAVLAMTGLFLLSACDTQPSVTENNLTDPGMDGVPPTLTTVSIQPDGGVELGQSVRIDIVASEALMTPVVYINDGRAEVTGSIDSWRAVREMTEDDPIGEVTFSIVYEDISGETGQVVLTTTNGSSAEYCGEECPQDIGPLEGKWRVTSIGVGPAEGDTQWYSLADSSGERACYFDDLYEFGADGSFRNVQGSETWLEEWQGANPPTCGAPLAPHDGSNNAIFEYDEDAGTLKLTGKGAYLGLSKVVNGAELADPALAPSSVTYNVAELIGNSLTVTIDVAGDGSAWWQFELTRVSNYPVVGKWKLDGEGSAGVGPAPGDTQWWSLSAADVETRACWLDDIYHFGDDGSFQNYHGAETWLEEWQGANPPACGAPVAPHDGSTAGTWTYDEDDGIVSLNGLGSYLGLAKAVNGAELGDPANAPDSVAYDILDLEGDTMTVTVDVAGDGTSWWTFRLRRVADTADLSGKWRLDTEGGAGVGPAPGDTQWWVSDSVVDERACWFDDVFEFGRDGSFSNEQGGETWLEEWQGANPPACGAPVAPHDGSARAVFEYDEVAGTVTIYGTGAHLGLAKAVNGAELTDPADAPESVTYDVLSLIGDKMTVTIDVAGDGTSWWTFNLVRSSGSPMVGNWKLDGEGSAGVGPVAGDTQWWSLGAADVETRACWLDDVFHFGGDGTFQNFQGGETWLEEWQGANPPACGAPLAPHDGSSAGRYAYDDGEQELTLLGTGSHLGLAKAVNGAELVDPLAAPESITYDVLDLEGDVVTVTIDVAGDGTSWWTFRLARE
jgi:hypothetical protein